MRFLKFTAMACGAIFCSVCAFPVGRLLAQAPPGPMTPSQPLPPPKPSAAPKKQQQIDPRKTLEGYWKLNSDDSDDPRRKIEAARQTDARSRGGMGGGGNPGGGYPYPGGGPGGPVGGPGGGNGPYGGSGRGMGDENNENTERTLDMVRPAYAQSIALKDTEVDATTDRDDKLVFYTDGRKIQKSKDNSLQQISAHWDGGQLVTDEKGPQGRKMSRTIELSPDGRQLYETWHIDNGRSGSAIVIRYVYEAANQYER
jgi:hypothetical protein